MSNPVDPPIRIFWRYNLRSCLVVGQVGAYRGSATDGMLEVSGRSGPIDRRWLPLNALRAFEMVGRHLSFTGAAQSMHISQSALSRHVAMLEDLLGQPLLARRPHGLALTEAGGGFASGRWQVLRPVGAGAERHRTAGWAAAAAACSYGTIVPPSGRATYFG